MLLELAARVRRVLYKVYVEAELGQVTRSLNAANARADNEN
jgi:hypothetical protein